MRHRVARALFVPITAALLPLTVRAQTPCTQGFDVLEVPNALDGALRDSLFWDRDGGGPLPAELVIAGDFRRIGGVACNGVARRDAVLGWQPLGAGCDGAVHALAIDGANRLVAGGSFVNAGGVAAPRIARFDGAQWSALAASPPALTGTVTSLVAVDATTLYYIDGGQLGVFDGAAVAGIPLAPGASGVFGSVRDLARRPNGNLLIGGSFSAIGGQAANNVAEYAHGVGVVGGFAGGTNGLVRDVEVLPNGDLLAFGAFTAAGGAATGNVARFTATGWQSYPSPGFLDGVEGGGADASGEPIAFARVGINAGIKRFASGAWQTIFATAMLTTHAGLQPDGSVLFGNLVGTSGPGLAPAFGYFWQNGQTAALADGANGALQAVAELADGGIVAYLREVSGTPGASGLPAPGGFVRYDGAVATALPTGAPPRTALAAPGQVLAILPQPDGGFVAAGEFATIGGLPITGIARFDGTTWQPLGAGVGEAVVLATQTSDGDVVVVTQSMRLARFDGAQWVTVAPAPIGVIYSALGAARDGSFFVGRFLPAGSPITGVDHWTAGNVLAATLPTSSTVNAIAAARDGALVIATSSGVLRYDGASVSVISTPNVAVATAVAVLPDGSVVANGGPTPTGGPTLRSTQRFDGAAWTPLHTNGIAQPVALRNGDLLLAGSIQLDATRSSLLARRTGSCPSTSAAIASGCATGAATLTSDAPWVGQTLRLEARGLPFAAFALAVGSTQPANLPLASAFATAIPGCALLVQPDVTSLQFAVNGGAQLAFAIPNSPAVVGAAFRQQFVSFAFDATLAVGATNALALVVGGY